MCLFANKSLAGSGCKKNWGSIHFDGGLYPIIVTKKILLSLIMEKMEVLSGHTLAITWPIICLEGGVREKKVKYYLGILNVFPCPGIT
jgi:hypothetical protein